jgi:hypothetical protein
MSVLAGRLLSGNIENDMSSTHHDETMTLTLEKIDHTPLVSICDPLLYAQPSPESTDGASTLG